MLSRNLVGLELLFLLFSPGEEVYEEMERFCWKENITQEELVKVLFQINQELDTIQLIKIDTQKVYNSSRVEQENKVKGY